MLNLLSLTLLIMHQEMTAQAWKSPVELMLILMSLPSTQMVTLIILTVSSFPLPSSLHNHPLEPFQTHDASLAMGGLVTKTRKVMISFMSQPDYQRNQDGRPDGMFHQMKYRIRLHLLGTYGGAIAY